MTPLVIKICGLTTPEAVAAAVSAGADALGFVFSESPRQVSVSKALALVAEVPRGIVRVAVMRHPPPNFAAQIVQQFQPDWVQTDLADFSGFDVPPPAASLPVLREGAVPETLPDWFLYEGAHSGTGEAVDWQRASALARRARLMLAGGLSPANVAEAVRRVRPWGIDVSSGVEASRGIKSPALIKRFVEAARAEQL